MKRKNKCAGKRAYAFKDQAIRVAKRIYQKQHTVCAVYECPQCLDFHLTTKWTNMQHLHRKWDIEWMESTYREFLRLDGSVVVEKPKKIKVKKERVRDESSAEKKKKANTLPLAEQKRIFATFDGKIYPQRKSFWSVLRGIILGAGDGGVA